MLDNINVGELVAARYEGLWYIGQVEEIDKIDEEPSLMEKRKDF